MSGGNGVTRFMRNVRGRPPEFVHRHTYPSRWDRRNKRDDKGVVSRRSSMTWGGNTTYYNPGKDRTLRGKARRRANRAARREAKRD